MLNKAHLLPNASPDVTSINQRLTQKLKKERCCTSICYTLWILFGVFLLIGSLQIVWTPTYLQNAVHAGITKAFVFTEPRTNDKNYNEWLSNDQGADSVPIHVHLQFFNVTNPSDLTNGLLPLQQRLPKFNLSPPIVYTQYFYRENVSFSDDGTQARSFFKTRFHLDEKLSEITEDDVFTIIGPLVSGGRHLYDKQSDPDNRLHSFLYNELFEMLDSNVSHLFTTANVRDLVFDVLDFKYPINDTTFMDINIPAGSVVDYKYGLLKNGSGSWYVTHTGYGDESRMGEVLKWSNQPQDWTYSKQDPVLINFDDHNFTFVDCWYPHLPYSPSHFIYEGVWRLKDDPGHLPPFFVSTLKKALLFDYDESVKYKGIPAQRYNVSTGQQLMNDSLYPPNAQYFQFGTSGVLNMTHCFNDLPLFFSLPKFYGSPDFQINNTKMNIPMPTAEDNGFLMVEPMTGAILSADVALQGNVQIKPLPHYGKNITDSDASLIHLPSNIMAPTYLLRYAASLPDKGAKRLKEKIDEEDDFHNGFYIFGYVCMSVFMLYWSYTMHWIGKNGCKKLCCCRKAPMCIQDSRSVVL